MNDTNLPIHRKMGLGLLWLFGALMTAFLLAGCGGGGGRQPTQFTISGTVTPAANSHIDGDVNDPMASYFANDDFSEAQEIPNPFILGGYVNQAGTGQPGRSFIDGDENDYYYTRLFANQTLALNVADTGSDVDVYLYAESNTSTPVASNTGGSQIKTISIIGTGNYYIRINAQNNASNYILSIGSSGATFAPSHIHSAFMTGEAIVRIADQPTAITDRARFVSEIRDMGMQLKSGAPGREMLLQFDQSAVIESQRNLRRQSTTPDSDESVSLYYELVAQLDTLRQIEALQQRDDIAYAEPNYLRKALLEPDDTFYSLQWHYSLINMPEAWDITTGNTNIVVAVVDSGVIFHPDLSNQLTSDGYDFISDVGLAIDGDGVDADPQDPGDRRPEGSSFHGTHVAGTIAAQTDNNSGVAGVGWSVSVMPLRALGLLGNGTSYDILQAVRYAAGLSNDYDLVPSQVADIINLSLGGEVSSQAEQDVYNLVRQAGVIVVAAAGNNAESAPSYPAAYDGVISVSAVDINGNPTPYSNFGATVDVAAPGGDMTRDIDGDNWPDGVLSTGAIDTQGFVEIVYRYLQGTSMATPHMSGVAALMKSVDPSLSPSLLDALLVAGSLTTDLGPIGRDNRYGYGLIDAQKALLAVQAGVVPTTLTVNPNTVNLGTDLNSAVLNAQKFGPFPLEITDVSNDADWLTVTEAQVDANGLGQYIASVDRTGLDAGLYSALITFESTENTVTIPINLVIPYTIAKPHVGNHYVLLLDPNTYATRYQVQVQSKNGFYQYRFTDVAPGDYIIFAGTNLDQDRFIGDEGESAGAYLSLDTPVVISVDGNRSELHFSTEFNINVSQNRTLIPGKALILPD